MHAAEDYSFCMCGQGPFTYEALPPSDIAFVPLKQTREFTADALLQVHSCYPEVPSQVKNQHLCHGCKQKSLPACARAIWELHQQPVISPLFHLVKVMLSLCT